MIKTPASSITEVDHYPLKVCVVTDNDASARSAVRMIQRVSKATNFRITLLHLDQFVSPSNGGSLAPALLDSELFIVAMSHGGELPGFTKAWIERWAYLRGEDNDCALVAFVTNGSSPLDSRSPLVEYLGALAGGARVGILLVMRPLRGCIQIFWWERFPKPSDVSVHAASIVA